MHYKEVTGSLEPSHPNFEHAVGEVTRDHVHRVVDEGFTYPMNFRIILLEPVVALKLVGFETRWDYKISQEDYYTKPYPSYITPVLDNALEIYDTFSYFSETEQIRVFLNFVPIFCEIGMER